MIESSRRIGVGTMAASGPRGWARVAHISALQMLEQFHIRAVSTTRNETARATAAALDVEFAFDNHK